MAESSEGAGESRSSESSEVRARFCAFLPLFLIEKPLSAVINVSDLFLRLLTFYEQLKLRRASLSDVDTEKGKMQNKFYSS